MGIRVLNHQTEDQFGRVHGKTKPDRCPEVVKIDKAGSDVQMIQQLRDGGGVRVKRGDRGEA
jgi:hypothetical protein